MTTIIYTIYGFEGCGYYEAALNILRSLANSNKKIKIQTLAVPKVKWQNTLQNLHKNHKLGQLTKEKVAKHFTSPLIIRGNSYIGGHDNLRTHLKL